VLVSTAALLAASAAAALAACGAPERGAPPPPAALATLALPEPAPAPRSSLTPSASERPAVSESAPEPGPPPPVSDLDSFECGDTRCRSGLETCCANGREGTCLPSVNDAPIGEVGYLKTQWEHCDAVKFPLQASFDRMARCDESIDCEPNHVCCEQWLFSGSSGLADCLPLPRGGGTPCDFGETCIEGSSCRTPGTECDSGMCRKKLAERACGSEKCSGDRPVCCSEPLGCVAEGACATGKRLVCTGHADCVKGEKCIANGFGGTTCAKAVVHPDYAPYLCKRDADCPNPCTSMPGAKAVCMEASIPWLGYCQCIDGRP
jgi:hypothetical protein